MAKAVTLSSTFLMCMNPKRRDIYIFSPNFAKLPETTMTNNTVNYLHSQDNRHLEWIASMLVNQNNVVKTCISSNVIIVLIHTRTRRQLG